MKSKLMLATAITLAVSVAGAAYAKPDANQLAAVADKARPEADSKRDADRKPADMLEFAGVKSGQTVVELIPGGGYFTRILSKAVGPKGTVYAVGGPVRPPADPAKPPPPPAQNYHDVNNVPNIDMLKFDKSVYDALKPGGVFIVLDHAAAAGTALDPQDKLHRIDPAIVRKQVEAAGFKFDGESKVLANPADDHTKTVFDPSIRGHTDQFIFKFRKPK